MTAASVATLLALAVLSFSLVLVFRGTSNGRKASAASRASSSPASPTPAASGGVACGGSVPKAASEKKPQFKAAPPEELKAGKTYTATIETSCGTIVVRLDPKLAPHTVNSFVFLARHHFYDGLIFHRVAHNFVIQGGDPTGTGSGGPGYSTVDAPPKSAKYTQGVVAMAKTGSEPAGTSGSQFFIVTAQDAGLPPDYAIIGHVVKGQDVANTVGALPVQGGGNDGRPVQTVYIVKVTIAES